MVAKARAWALRTLPRLQRLAKRKETGITERRIYMMYRKPGSSYDELAGLPGFRREATVAQVSQAFRGGASYLAPQAFMPQYLCWLQQEVFRLGGSIHVGDDYKVKDLSAASIRQLDGAMPKLLVNCLGLASREVVPDEAMLPIRGGLVYVHCPEVEDVFFDEDDPDGEATYVIPQRNGLVACGGLVQRNREAAALSEAEAAGILGRCERLLPALRGQKVLGTWTGLRPARRAEAGGIRLELELADLPAPSAAIFG
ncbi:unnamed protein product [Effrenium voratum]|nr:unnamed protein product [Effrenium voratum]